MSKPIRMLTIDDRMLTTDLDRAGYRNMGIAVKHVSSFKDAQDAVEDGAADIIVINMDFEKVDGIAICQHFKSNDEYKEIPVVLTSVQSAASVKKSALGAGADLFVEQPLPRQYFIEKLKTLLEQQTRGNDRVEGLDAMVVLKIKGKTYDLPIGDISTSGMLVTTDLDLPDQEAVEMTFSLPGYRKPIQAKGQVVRKINTIAGNTAHAIVGVGIRFESFQGDSQKRLDKYVAKSNDKEGKMIYYL